MPQEGETQNLKKKTTSVKGVIEGAGEVVNNPVPIL